MSNGVTKSVRRRFSRIDEVIPLRYTVRKSADTPDSTKEKEASLNIGSGGLLFRINDALPASTIIDMELHLTNVAEPLQAVGRVVRVEESAVAGQYDIGIQFLEISRKDRETLTKYIQGRLQIDIQVEDTGPDKEITAVKLKGFLDSGTRFALEKSLDFLLNEGCTKMIFDCSGLDYINSEGMMIFISTATELQSKGGALKLASIRGDVKQTLQIIGVEKFIDTFDSIEEAIEAF